MRWTDFLNWFRAVRSRSPRVIESLADELAERALPKVWRRVRKRIGRMSMCEARGYVRARATTVVHEQVDAHMRADSLPASIRPRLVESVVERVVERTMHEATAIETLGALARAA